MDIAKQIEILKNQRLSLLLQLNQLTKQINKK
jgi:hypothetical protein